MILPVGSDWGCSRWSSAYPYILHQAEHFGDSRPKSKFLACSGATSTDIKEKQVKELADKSQDLITLSTGANDVGIIGVLNACVYQFTPFGNRQSETDKVAAAITQKLGDRLDDLYKALKPKLTDGAKIFQPGYAQVWNAETDSCDAVGW